MQFKLQTGVEEHLRLWIFTFLKFDFKHFLKTSLIQTSKGMPISIQLHVCLKTVCCNLVHMDHAIFYFTKTCLDMTQFSYSSNSCTITVAILGWHSGCSRLYRLAYVIGTLYSCCHSIKVA